MANRFWVGGTGTWDASSTTHWSSGSGGAGGASVPGTGDLVVFNANSGGGTVTVATDVAVQSIDMSSFTGTLDFSVNNNNVTLSVQFVNSGTGARTLNLGNGTWTITNASAGTLWAMSTTTNLTFDAGASVIAFTGVPSSPSLRSFQGGGLTYATLQLGAAGGAGAYTRVDANTFGILSVAGPNLLEIAANITVTALALNGTSSGQVFVRSSADGTSRTISVASNAPTMSYCAFRDITGSGGASFVANNSFDLGHNSGITINPPIPGNSAASSILRSPLSPPV